MAYWIFCQPCQNKEARPAAESHKSSQLDSPNFWAKIKDWFSPSEKGETKQQNKPRFPTGSGEKMETRIDMNGHIVVFRQTEIIEFLHVDDMAMTLPLSVPACQEISFLVASAIQVDPEEILMFQKIEIREKSITYWLLELGPDSEVFEEYRWFPLKDSLKVSAMYVDTEDYRTALQDCHNKIERRPNQVPADPKTDINEEINCSKEILITGIVSALTMITGFALIFPEETDQLKNAVNGYSENAKEGLKVKKEKAVEAAQTLWNQMSNYFS